MIIAYYIYTYLISIYVKNHIPTVVLGNWETTLEIRTRNGQLGSRVFAVPTHLGSSNVSVTYKLTAQL